MGFLDNIRDRISGRADDDYYDDDYYDDDDDYIDEDEDEEPAYESHGLLGNSRRPEPESVAVFTRSGHHVSEGGGAYGDTYDDGDGYSRAPQPVGGYAPRDTYVPAGEPEPHVIPRGTSSTHLPPYVLRPASYDDAQMVVRRVRTNQPVVLVLHSTNIDAAKRILDFCYGFSLGAGGAVQELGDRVFVVLPAGAELSQADIDKLVADGDLVR